MSTVAIPSQQFGAARQLGASSALRLTRRGKVVVVALALAAIALLALVLGPAVAASGQGGAADQARTVTIMADQTLWQIAAEANPRGDIRDTVDDIVRLNSLPSASAATPGTTIAVPVY